MWKDSFKPAKHNLIPAGVFTALFWMVIFRFIQEQCNRMDCMPLITSCFRFPLKILPTCCGCNTAAEFFLQLLLIIVIPFTLVYVVSSTSKLIFLKHK